MRCTICKLELTQEYVSRFGDSHLDAMECIDALRALLDGPKKQEPPDLVDEIVLRRARRLKLRAKQYERKNPIASDIDPDSCLRRQVLEIVAWEDKPLLDNPSLQAMFEAGDWLENRCKLWLIEDGFDVIEGQTRFELKHRRTGEICLSGKTDFAIQWGVYKPRVEHKMVSPFIFNQIQEAGDFDQKKFPWMRKYPAQLQSYLIGQNEPWGLFMITDGRGDWRAIRVELDYEFAERIWSFAETIVEWVDVFRADESLPDFTKDQDQCARCPFKGRTCNPPEINDAPQILASGELEILLSRRDELKEDGKEYEKLDKAVKKSLKELRPNNGKKLVVGDFVIEYAKQKRKTGAIYVPNIQRV